MMHAADFYELRPHKARMQSMCKEKLLIMRSFTIHRFNQLGITNCTKYCKQSDIV